MSQQIDKDKYVSLTYSITDDSGDVLERADTPIELVFGRDHKIIARIEQALAGKQPGDRLSVSLSPAQGFGPHLEELTCVEDIDEVPREFRHIGAEIEFRNDLGDCRIFRVTRIREDKLTLDGNHPFAGKQITYNITIRDVRDASADELTQGHIAGTDSRLH